MLFRNEREQSHKSRAFDRKRELALVLHRDSRALSRETAAVGIQELLQNIGVFVVNVFDVVRTKVILFHNS